VSHRNTVEGTVKTDDVGELTTSASWWPGFTAVLCTADVKLALPASGHNSLGDALNYTEARNCADFTDGTRGLEPMAQLFNQAPSAQASDEGRGLRMRIRFKTFAAPSIAYAPCGALLLCCVNTRTIGSVGYAAR